MNEPHAWTYREAGVDIDAATEGLNRVKPLLKKTFNSRVLTDIGSFGGLFDASFPELSSPVLVSSCDGVGTKLKLAFQTGIHHTVGADLVNHCINDILVQGAVPLFFLDYFATGRMSPDVVSEVIRGMANACLENGVCLIGGETAEMPGMYADGEYDLAGFVVGVADRSRLILGDRIQPGDRVLALPSTGLHTNGYSLAQKIAFEVAGKRPDTFEPALGETIGEALMRVHRCYLEVIRPMLAEDTPIHGLAHITGGGLSDNVPRILPDGCHAVLDVTTWTTPKLFELLVDWGNVPARERYRAFNMGVGFVIVVPEAAVESTCARLRDSGEEPWELGRIEAGAPGVTLVGVD